MGKTPYLPFYYLDWGSDARLSQCSPATRGIWADLICDMHDLKESVVTGRLERLARTCRCNIEEMKKAIEELIETKTAEIEEKDGVYTITNRRRKKEDLEKESPQESGWGKGSGQNVDNPLPKNRTPRISISNKPPKAPLLKGAAAAASSEFEVLKGLDVEIKRLLDFVVDTDRKNRIVIRDENRYRRGILERWQNSPETKGIDVDAYNKWREKQGNLAFQTMAEDIRDYLRCDEQEARRLRDEGLQWFPVSWEDFATLFNNEDRRFWTKMFIGTITNDPNINDKLNSNE